MRMLLSLSLEQQSCRPWPGSHAAHSARCVSLSRAPQIPTPSQTHFRVWAPRRQRVAVVLEGPSSLAIPLAAEGNGYFAGTAEAGAGTRYRFQLDDESTLYPDPASRFQPDGPHGPSEVIDP